jgi:Cof subfamily protein (haloacid dehalogenase superfamily)
MRKLFAFDIDGTLLDHTDHQIPKSAMESLLKLKKQGHIIGIATGRNKSQLEFVIDLSLFDFAIMCNGSYGEIKGEKVVTNNFPKEKVTKITELLDSFNYEYVISSEDHLYGKNPNTKKINKVIKQFDLITPDVTDNYFSHDIYQIVVCEPTEILYNLDTLKEDVLFHTFGDFGFDIDQKGITKGSILRDMAQHFNIDIKDVYAFGDAPNDIDLVRKAGVGIAMGNAVQEVKDAADYITTHVGDNGIYNALKKFSFVK